MPLFVNCVLGGLWKAVGKVLSGVYMDVDVHVELECCYVVGGCNVVAAVHGQYIETVVCRNCMRYAETVSSAGSVGYAGSFNFYVVKSECDRYGWPFMWKAVE